MSPPEHCEHYSRCERCERCGRGRIDVTELSGLLESPVIASMPADLVDELAGCAHCLAHDGVMIDRAHLEATHRRFGAYGVPLEPAMAERAMTARPELAGATLLVAEDDAVLEHPAASWRRRLEALVRLNAPEVVLEQTRATLADWEKTEVRIEWERVHAWPAPKAFRGTVAFGEIARTMAAHAIPPLVGVSESDAILAAIDRAIDLLALDAHALAYRHALAEASRAAEAAGERRRHRGLELAVRFLDELGSTGLRDNQDTLVDDCYFALKHQGVTDVASRTYRTWLMVAVPRAWRRIATV